MRWVGVFLLGALALGCGSAGFHPGRSALQGSEQANLVGGRRNPSAVFRRFWLATSPKPWGLVKWDEKSSAPKDAPSDLLQTIRDEVGRLNQRAGTGEDLMLAVTVYEYRPESWSRKATVSYELVARDRAGKVLWAADDEIRPTPAMATSLVDTDAIIVGREVLRKIREQFSI